MESRIVNGRPTAMAAELVLDARAELAEGPVWDDRRHVLWWVDIVVGRLHRFDPRSRSDVATEIGSAVGCVALTAQGMVMAAAADALLLLDPDTGGRRMLASFPDAATGTAGPRLRCNDGKCDSEGRFWVGRMALDRTPGAAMLIRVDGRGAVPVLRDLTIPNGLDWSGDGRRMYFVHSPDRLVSVMDFDPDTGEAGPRRVWWRTSDVPGLPWGSVPDGLTVDADGHVWVAIWGGGSVLRLTPDGTVDCRVEVPVARVSSCVFGGDEMTELFITTAREDATDQELTAQPAAGGLYRVIPGARGRPPNRMKLEWPDGKEGQA
jgi:sugar lactone lactonase YvrE